MDDIKRCVWGLQQANRTVPTPQRKSKIDTYTRSWHIPNAYLLKNESTLSHPVLPCSHVFGVTVAHTYDFPCKFPKQNAHVFHLLYQCRKRLRMCFVSFTNNECLHANRSYFQHCTRNSRRHAGKHVVRKNIGRGLWIEVLQSNETPLPGFFCHFFGAMFEICPGPLPVVSSQSTPVRTPPCRSVLRTCFYVCSSTIVAARSGAGGVF